MYRNLENTHIRKNCLQYVALPLWENLSVTRRNLEFEEFPLLQDRWTVLIESRTRVPAPPSEEAIDTSSRPLKKRKKVKTIETPSTTPQVSAESDVFPRLLDMFYQVIGKDDALSESTFVYKFLELIHDLLTQIPTRRFLNAYLDGNAVLLPSPVTCKVCLLYMLCRYSFYCAM
jgi:intron-binding protein aquarius